MCWGLMQHGIPHRDEDSVAASCSGSDGELREGIWREEGGVLIQNCRGCAEAKAKANYPIGQMRPNRVNLAQSAK